MVFVLNCKGFFFNLGLLNPWSHLVVGDILINSSSDDILLQVKAQNVEINAFSCFICTEKVQSLFLNILTPLNVAPFQRLTQGLG